LWARPAHHTYARHTRQTTGTPDISWVKSIIECPHFRTWISVHKRGNNRLAPEIAPELTDRNVHKILDLTYGVFQIPTFADIQLKTFMLQKVLAQN